MNKRHFKLTAFSLFFILILAFSCKQQTIFYQIEQETELEEAVVSGNINALVSFNGKLYACDGKIYSKNSETIQGWEKINKPNGRIIKLAANATELYSLNNEKKLFMSTDGMEWKEADTTSYELSTIFCDGAGKAYAKAKAKDSDTESFYSLSNGGLIQTTEVSGDILASYNGVTYTTEGETVKDTLGGQATKLGRIYSLSYSPKEKALYVGTDEGLKKLVLDDNGRLTGEKKDPPGNWESTIKEYEIFAVLSTDNAIYCSVIENGSVYASVTGLWSYYYDKRDSWNVE